MMLLLFPSPQEWIWVVLNLNLPQSRLFLTIAAFDTAVDGGLEQQAVAEINQAAPPKQHCQKQPLLGEVQVENHPDPLMWA